MWVNGKFVGYSEDSFTPSEFEVTEFLKDGQNKVAVEKYIKEVVLHGLKTKTSGDFQEYLEKCFYMLFQKFM